MSEPAIQRLQRGHDVAWSALKPVYVWAIHEVAQAEYEAARTSNTAQTYVAPVYPPVVQLLIDSVPEATP